MYVSIDGVYQLDFLVCVCTLQIPDQDLEERRINQKVNPLTNKVYVANKLTVSTQDDADDKHEEEELEEENESENETSRENDDYFAEDLVCNFVLVQQECFTVILFMCIIRK